MDMEISPAWLREAPVWAVVASLLSAAVYWFQRVVRGDIKSDRRDKVSEDVTGNLMKLWTESTARADSALADLAKVSQRVAELGAEIVSLRAHIVGLEKELIECNAERQSLLRDFGAQAAALKAERLLDANLKSRRVTDDHLED